MSISTANWQARQLAPVVFGPELITALTGTLANGATYAITGGTNVQLDGSGNIRWEATSTFLITITGGMAELVVTPVDSTAVVGNPFVWSNIQGGAIPSRIQGNGAGSGLFTYTPGAFDMMAEIYSGPERIRGGVSNGAIAASDDWGVVRGHISDVFSVRGRDAEAMRFQLIPQ